MSLDDEKISFKFLNHKESEPALPAASANKDRKRRFVLKRLPRATNRQISNRNNRQFSINTTYKKEEPPIQHTTKGPIQFIKRNYNLDMGSSMEELRECAQTWELAKWQQSHPDWSGVKYFCNVKTSTCQEDIQEELKQQQADVNNNIRNIRQSIAFEQNRIALELEKQVFAIGKNQNSKHYQIINNIVNRMQSMPNVFDNRSNQEYIYSLILDCQNVLNGIEAGQNPFNSTHFISRQTATDKKLIPMLKAFLRKSQLCLQQKLYVQQMEDTLTMINNEKRLTTRPDGTIKNLIFFKHFSEKYQLIQNETTALMDLMNKYQNSNISSEHVQNILSESILSQQKAFFNFMCYQRNCYYNVARFASLNHEQPVDMFNPVCSTQIDVYNTRLRNNYNMPHLYNNNAYSSNVRDINHSYISNTLATSRYSGYSRDVK